ncbi:MAG: hypothetical protein V4593_08175 [Pseudomonadota bacterium]
MGIDRTRAELTAVRRQAAVLHGMVHEMLHSLMIAAAASIGGGITVRVLIGIAFR